MATIWGGAALAGTASRGNGLGRGAVLPMARRAALLGCSLLALTSGAVGQEELHVGAGEQVGSIDDKDYFGGLIEAGGTYTIQGTDVVTNFGNLTNTGDLINTGDLYNDDILYIGNGGTRGTLTGNVINRLFGEIYFNRSDASAYAGVISGAGSLFKQGAGTLTLTGDSSGFDGHILAEDGTLAIAQGGKLGSEHGWVGRDQGSDGTVTVSGSDGQGNVSTWDNDGDLFIGEYGRGTLTIANGGEVSTGDGWAVSIGRIDETSTGTINIGAAPTDDATGAGKLLTETLQFGDGIGTLNFNHTDTDYEFSAALDSGGGDDFYHSLFHYAGITTLTGDSSGFMGVTDVRGGRLIVGEVGKLAGSGWVRGGTLQVDGEFMGDVWANGTGIVAGAGTITGNADFIGNSGLAGEQGQTLTITGDAAFDDTSHIAVTLGGASTSALFAVGGHLTLDGTLDVTAAGGFGAGLYGLFDYGTLTDNGLAIGDTPSGVTAAVQIAADENQVNLILTGSGPGGGTDEPTFGFWDGGDAGLHGNGAVNGGDGTWGPGGQNWTNGDGTTNGPFQPDPSFAIFQGAAGVVTLDTTDGAIGVMGMQFATDGYSVEGGAIALEGEDGETSVRVGTGNPADAGMTATLAADLTGSSTLVKTDYGTLILTGTNSYIGGTRVDAGTLIGDAGAIKGNLANAGTVVFDQASNAAFAGNVAGTGLMTKAGAGTLTLTGRSDLDWTVAAGGLVSAADRFSGDAAIAGGASLSFEQTVNGAYAGSLSGSGSFTKAGSGSVLLTGDSSDFAGTTTVTGGQLIVGRNEGGALGGALTIAAGGLLGGSGDVGAAGSAVTVAANAVHAPGNSIAVQHVLGDYANHGTLRIEATPTEADGLVVAGAVDITGATLDLVLSPTDAARWDVFNGPFTIIDKQSAGAVAGSFADPAARNLLFLDSLLDYEGGDGNDVTLSLTRNDLAFAGVGLTRNQIATGTAIDTLDAGNAVWRAIALTADQDVVRASFDALSGEIHASARGVLIQDSAQTRDAANERIRAAFDGVGASVSPVLAYGPGGPELAAPAAEVLTAWGGAFGSWGHLDGDGNAAGVDTSTGGLLIGADTLVGDWRVGIMAGYGQSGFDAAGRASSGTSDNYTLGLYGGTEWGNLAFRTGLAYGWHDIETTRSALGETLSGDYGAGTLQGFGELGYRIDMGAAAFEPFVNLAHVRLDTDGFTETGGAAALASAGQSSDATFTTLGLRASSEFAMGTTLVTAHAMLGWRHALGDITPTAGLAFAGSDAFTVAGAPLARDTALIEAGLDFDLSDNARLGLSYTGQIAGTAQDHGIKASLGVKF